MSEDLRTIDNHFEFEIDYFNYGIEYNNIREYLKKIFGKELVNIEKKERIRKILIEEYNSENRDFEFIKEIITKDKRYLNSDFDLKAGALLYILNLSTRYRKYELLEDYKNIRDVVSEVLGMYNTYLIEESIEFQKLCSVLSCNDYYKIYKILKTVKTVKYFNPFINKEIYYLEDACFDNILNFTEYIISPNENISDEQIVSTISERIKIVLQLSKEDLYREIYFPLASIRYDNNSINFFRSKYKSIKSSKMVFSTNLRIICHILKLLPRPDITCLFKFILSTNDTVIDEKSINIKRVIEEIYCNPKLAADIACKRC